MKLLVISIRFRKVNTNGLQQSVHTIGQFHSEKDETDTELRWNGRFLSSGTNHFNWGTGGRLDHIGIRTSSSVPASN